MNRSAVMTLANALYYKKHLNRSDALKRAWRMVKQAEFHSKAVGVSFRLRQKALEHLKAYAPSLILVTLKHEPDNQHDKNAVAIMVSVAGSLWAWLVAKQQVKAIAPRRNGRRGQNMGVQF